MASVNDSLIRQWLKSGTLKVLESGKLISADTEQELRKNSNTNGYWTVEVPRKLSKQSKRVFIHRVIGIFLFGDSVTPKSEINHINNNKRDNRFSNLEVKSRKEHHALRLGRKISKPAPLLDEKSITDIRTRYINGDSTYKIAKDYERRPRTISEIVRNNRYPDPNYVYTSRGIGRRGLAKFR